MPTFSAVPCSFTNKIASCLGYIRPMDAKQQWPLKWFWLLHHHTIVALNCNQWTIIVYLIISNKLDWDCIFGIVSALPCYGMAPTWTKLCLCLYICTLLMQGQWEKGRDCHVMMLMHKRWIKHDALTSFCNSNIMCHKISEMKYLSKHMHENDMWFSYQSHSRITIFYDSDSNSIQLGLIPILISVLSPIPGFTKIMILIPILIPVVSDSDSNKPGFDSDSDSGISFRFRNHLQVWYIRPLQINALI